MSQICIHIDRKTRLVVMMMILLLFSEIHVYIHNVIPVTVRFGVIFPVKMKNSMFQKTIIKILRLTI